MTEYDLTTWIAFWTYVQWLVLGVLAAYGVFFLYVWFRDRNGSN